MTAVCVQTQQRATTQGHLTELGKSRCELVIMNIYSESPSPYTEQALAQYFIRRVREYLVKKVHGKNKAIIDTVPYLLILQFWYDTIKPFIKIINVIHYSFEIVNYRLKWQLPYITAQVLIQPSNLFQQFIHVVNYGVLLFKSRNRKKQEMILLSCKKDEIPRTQAVIPVF